MLLRRISEHVKAQNWFAVGIDFVIVVVGVFIGIQVANWNDVQNDKRMAREYITRIQQDLLATQKDMHAQIEYSQWIKDHTVRALHALVQEPAALGSDFVVDSYIAGHSISVSLQRDTYVELLSVGALATIPNLEVRQRISQFFRNGDTIEEAVVVVPGYQSDMRGVMPNDVASVLRAGCGAVVRRDAQNDPVFEVPKGCPPKLTPTQISSTVENFRNVDLVPSLRRSLSDVEVKQSYFQQILDQSIELHDFLEENA